MFNYITKHDYLKLGKRENVHSTIREDIYLDLQILSKQFKEPITKILDILVLEIISDKNKQQELKNKLQNYR